MAGGRSHRGGGYGIFLVPGLLLALAVVVVPLAMNIGVSFTRWQGVGTPHWIGLQNYRRLIHDDNFWAILLNHFHYTSVHGAKALA